MRVLVLLVIFLFFNRRIGSVELSVDLTTFVITHVPFRPSQKARDVTDVYPDRCSDEARLPGCPKLVILGAGSIHSVLYLFPLWVGTYLGIMDNKGKTQNVQTEKVRNTCTIKVF